MNRSKEWITTSNIKLSYNVMGAVFVRQIGHGLYYYIYYNFELIEFKVTSKGWSKKQIINSDFMIDINYFNNKNKKKFSFYLFYYLIIIIFY
jgi:hypothetical protein